QVARLADRLEARRIVLRLTDDARNYLADVGYDPTYGARPLKRAIQRELETELARRLVAGEIAEGSRVEVGTVDDDSRRLTFQSRLAAAA
ncbi:MAG: hypothetical protein E4H03_14340, partial [Myxococcales bacterium]